MTALSSTSMMRMAGVSAGSLRGVLAADENGLIARSSAEARQQRVDLVLALRFRGQLRAVEQRGIAFRRRRGVGRLRMGTAEGAQQELQTALDLAQRLHHLGDALAAQILEAAGLVDAAGGVLELVAVGLAAASGHLFHRLGGLQDGTGRGSAVADDGIELVGGARQVATAGLTLSHAADVALHAVDEAGQQLELAVDLQIDAADISEHVAHDAVDACRQARLVRRMCLISLLDSRVFHWASPGSAD